MVCFSCFINGPSAKKTVASTIRIEQWCGGKLRQLTMVLYQQVTIARFASSIMYVEYREANLINQVVG